MYVLFSQRSLSEHCDLSGSVSLLWVTRESHHRHLNIVLGKQISQRDCKISELQLSYGNVPTISSDNRADNYLFYPVLSLVFTAPRMCLPQFYNPLSPKRLFCLLRFSVWKEDISLKSMWFFKCFDKNQNINSEMHLKSTSGSLFFLIF